MRPARPPAAASEGRAAAASAKDEMIAFLRELPDEAGWDDLLRELAFRRMVERGIAHADCGRTITTAELRRRIRTWPS